MSKFVLIVSLIFLCACNEDSTSTSDDLLAQMAAIDQEIEAMISTSCTASSQCMATAYGAKPCGGPTKYLVHSSDMDLTKFNELVDQYNSLNEQYNVETGAISDCSIVTKPEVDCISGDCQEVQID